MKANFKHSLFHLFLVISILLFSGCTVKEAGKKVLGISTQTLEEESRVNSISQSFECTYQECFRAVQSMARKEESSIPWERIEGPNDGDFRILMSDLYSNPPYIIVIGVEGNVNTTEVGIFLRRVSREEIRVDVSSLSSTAKRRVSELVFARLEEKFKTAE